MGVGGVGARRPRGSGGRGASGPWRRRSAACSSRWPRPGRPRRGRGRRGGRPGRGGWPRPARHAAGPAASAVPGQVVGLETVGEPHRAVGRGAGGAGGVGVPVRGRGGAGVAGDLGPVGVGQQPGLELGELGLRGLELASRGGLGGVHRPHRDRRPPRPAVAHVSDRARSPGAGGARSLSWHLFQHRPPTLARARNPLWTRDSDAGCGRKVVELTSGWGGSRQLGCGGLEQASTSGGRAGASLRPTTANRSQPDRRRPDSQPACWPAVAVRPIQHRPLTVAGLGIGLRAHGIAQLAGSPGRCASSRPARQRAAARLRQ